MKKLKNKVTDALLGITVGDAIGVPFEFSSRQKMKDSPAIEMIGHGTHNQLPGTWSDDSSLTFCLAESLSNEYSLTDISLKFIKWKNESYWSARGKVFDIGMTTSKAISRLRKIVNEKESEKELRLQKYMGDEFENGNGSLMRIMPLLFIIKGKPIKDQFEVIWEVSALTHRHIRAAMSCFIYLKLAENILMGFDKNKAYSKMRDDVNRLWTEIKFSDNEKVHFDKIIQNDITTTSINDLKSGGYVIEVLESSIWFFLMKESYKETVLSIINIGHDTDTSAAIVGGLAGLYYGHESIPEYWKYSLARYEDIIVLCDNLNKRVG